MHVRDRGTGAHQMTKVGRSQKSGLAEKKPPWLAGSVPSWLMNACVQKGPGLKVQGFVRLSLLGECPPGLQKPACTWV